ncbi:acyl carrier protein [Nocardia altamirensis]|uniref:acyl carrier protein n=1 Tax=Nocardia altamirensis TaxID=472158 RepID=UPI0008404B0D|nr:hypothetical protein [Nocardia altamirensis]
MADRTKIIDVLETAYTSVTRVPRTLTGSESLRDDLDVNSVSLLELFSKIEEELDIVLFENMELPDVQTVDDLVVLISTELDTPADRTA